MPTLRLPRLGCSISGCRSGFELEAAHVEEAALGVAADRMFDLDDVGAPVGQDRARRRDERELRDLQDPDAVHHLDHSIPFLLWCAYQVVTPGRRRAGNGGHCCRILL